LNAIGVGDTDLRDALMDKIWTKDPNTTLKKFTLNVSRQSLELHAYEWNNTI